MRPIGPGFLAFALLLGCGSKESVSLSATLVDPSIEVTSLALGTQLSGGFGLRLELGPEAPENTQVSLGSFTLRRDASEVVPSLPLLPEAGVTFPLTIGVGENRVVRLDFDSMSLLEAAQRDAICQGPLRIVGSVTDTLSGKAQNASSDSTTPSCPVQ